jgi:hypothetical protein
LKILFHFLWKIVRFAGYPLLGTKESFAPGFSTT